MPTLVQTQSGGPGTDFDGTGANGRITFGQYNAMPRSTRLFVKAVGLHATPGGPPPIASLELFWRLPGLVPQILIIDRPAAVAALVNADDSLDSGKALGGLAVYSDKWVPRSNRGGHWELVAITTGAAAGVELQLIVDFEPRAYANVAAGGGAPP